MGHRPSVSNGSALAFFSIILSAGSLSIRREQLAHRTQAQPEHQHIGYFHHFKISNQIRYEYRFTPDWNDYRIKNTLEISRPDIFLQPYIGWELFYENRNKDFMLHRIKFGIVKNISENVYLGTYYRIDFSNVNDEWEWKNNSSAFNFH